MKKKSFTLAEVLITLVIIGVVAALTIPTLIGKYKKIVVENQLKKTYASLSSAMKMATAQNGPPSSWDWSDSDKIIEEYFAPNIKYIKTYKNNNCLYGACFCEGKKHYGWSKGTIGMTTPLPPLSGIKGSSILLEDGACILITTHGTVYVDVNGNAASPNIMARDLFMFRFEVDTGLLRGYKATDYWGSTANSCPNDLSDNTGITECAARIMREGWKINYNF